MGRIPKIFNDQNAMFGILNFGDCYLFDIWDLLFGISVSEQLYLFQPIACLNDSAFSTDLRGLL